MLLSCYRSWPGMKIQSTGSTRTGDLILVWPELLDSTFALSDFDDLSEKFLQLKDEGKVLWIPAEPRREYHLLLVVDETIPAEIESYCQLTEKQDTLHVAGEGCFAEPVFDEAGVGFIAIHYSQFIPAIQIPSGAYSAEVFVTDVPAEVYETWLREQAGEGAQRLWWVQTWFASLGIVALMVFVGCLFFGTRQTVIYSGIVSAVLLGIAWLMSRTAGYRRIQQARREYAAAYPDFVVRLRQSSFAPAKERVLEGA
jgi:hypothetical protein